MAQSEGESAPNGDEAASVSAKFYTWLTCGVVLGVLPVLLSMFLPLLAGKGVQLVVRATRKVVSPAQNVWRGWWWSLVPVGV